MLQTKNGELRTNEEELQTKNEELRTKEKEGGAERERLVGAVLAEERLGLEREEAARCDLEAAQVDLQIHV